MGYSRQIEHTVTLLHQTHRAAEGTAGNSMCVSCCSYIVIVVVTLHPCRSIDSQYVRAGSVCYVDSHVTCLTHYYMFVVLSRTYGRAVNNLRTSCHCQWCRRLGDSFQFAKEIAHVRSLIVSAHLPNHGLTVLMVVPQSVVSPFCLYICGINTDIIVGRTHYHFLTPVTENISLIARCALGIIVGHTSLESGYRAFSHLIYSTGGILPVGIVKSLGAKVSVPIYTEILCYVALGPSRYGRMCHRTYKTAVSAGNTLGTGIVIVKVAHVCTSVIVTSCGSVINL